MNEGGGRNERVLSPIASNGRPEWACTSRGRNVHVYYTCVYGTYRKEKRNVCRGRVNKQRGSLSVRGNERRATRRGKEKQVESFSRLVKGVRDGSKGGTTSSNRLE